MPHSVDSRIKRLLARGDVAVAKTPGGADYWYRPGQLLVHRDDLDRLRVDLRRLGVAGEKGEPAGRAIRLRLPSDADIPRLVARLRDRREGAEVRVSPNHILAAAPRSAYGPDDLPELTHDDLSLPRLADADPRYVVGVLDTGLVLDRTRHRQGRNPHVDVHAHLALDAAMDEDELDTEPRDGVLDDVDVHGGFIADIIRFNAPRATVRVGKVLLGGIADEFTIAAAIGRMAGVQVLNLSLGGYTDANLAPFPIVDALEALDPRPVVVAAAGNDSRVAPFWPAALKGVIGVGAVDAPDGRLQKRQPAPFSNRGPWVDACAHGVKVLSTFVEFAERDIGETVTPQAFTGWARWSGTSFAAPLVAARIIQRAMEIDADPTWAAHRAAWELLNDRGATRVPDLGVFIP